MKLKDRIEAFAKLGDRIRQLDAGEIDHLFHAASVQNRWFTKNSIENALGGIAHLLQKEKLEKWLSDYQTAAEVPKIVGIVMAGNIPLVGFHDLLCVLIAGHFAAIKPSSDDEYLSRTLVDWLTEVEPRFKKNLEFRERLTQIDAVIATGSDNTARYFEYYFKDIHRIIRKNRTSVAILTGRETDEEWRRLGEDIFSYFGLGCRNVSKVYTPQGFDIREVFPHFEGFSDINHHHKYRNNYDYYKSIYLVNRTPHLDTGFLLVQTTEELVSPISVLYHQEYETPGQLEKVLGENRAKIQCIVSQGQTPFGQTQRPELWDYADDVDTLEFLVGLNTP